MNPTARSRIAGWAALGVAIAIPLKFVASLVVLTDTTGGVPIALPIVVELAEFVALALAALGFNGWFVVLGNRLGTGALAAGLAAAAIGIFLDVGELARADLSDEVRFAIGLAAQVAIGAWFVLAGTLVGRDASTVQRSGWYGQLGGAGFLIGAAAVLLHDAGIGGIVANLSLLALVLTLFGVAFLVRVGRFAVLGQAVPVEI